MTRSPKTGAARSPGVAAPPGSVRADLPGQPPATPYPGTTAGGTPSSRTATPQELATGPSGDAAAVPESPSLPGGSPVRAAAQTPAGGVPGAGGALPDRSGRTFTIALPPGLALLSLNDRSHWAARYRRAQVIKDAACVVARHAKVPRLGRARIVVEYQPPDLRHRDADNPVASAKAAVDGIVMAGVLEDDECPRYVTGIWCTIGPLYPKGRLVLRITEVTP